MRYVDALPLLLDAFERSPSWPDWAGSDRARQRWLTYNLYSIPARCYELTTVLDHYTGGAPLRNADVLDLGCGFGTMDVCLLLDGGARSVTGVDLNPDLSAPVLAGLESELSDRLFFRQGDLTATPPEKETFDIAVSWDSLYYPGIRHADALRHVHACLRPGGIVIIKVINGAFPPRRLRRLPGLAPLAGRVAGDAHPNAPSGFLLTRALRQAGFEQVTLYNRLTGRPQGLVRWFLPNLLVIGLRPRRFAP